MEFSLSLEKKEMLSDILTASERILASGCVQAFHILPTRFIQLHCAKLPCCGCLKHQQYCTIFHVGRKEDISFFYTYSFLLPLCSRRHRMNAVLSGHLPIFPKRLWNLKCSVIKQAKKKNMQKLQYISQVTLRDSQTQRTQKTLLLSVAIGAAVSQPGSANLPSPTAIS